MIPSEGKTVKGYPSKPAVNRNLRDKKIIPTGSEDMTLSSEEKKSF
jgi:hypothetical protein